jgi:hypothetical protein
MLISTNYKIKLLKIKIKSYICIMRTWSIKKRWKAIMFIMFKKLINKLDFRSPFIKYYMIEHSSKSGHVKVVEFMTIKNQSI